MDVLRTSKPTFLMTACSAAVQIWLLIVRSNLAYWVRVNSTTHGVLTARIHLSKIVSARMVQNLHETLKNNVIYKQQKATMNNYVISRRVRAEAIYNHSASRLSFILLFIHHVISAVTYPIFAIFRPNTCHASGFPTLFSDKKIVV